jgi:hypothetical protein
LGGVNIDAIWNHGLITGAVSGWLITRHLIGTVARGAFRLTPTALVERIVPLLGNPRSNEHYVAFVQRHVPTFDGWHPANFMYWRTSLQFLQEVVQLEQLTPAFIGWVMTNAPLLAGEAYGVCVYSRFIREAETHCLVLIAHNETPSLWGEDVLTDEQHAPAAVRPPPPSSSSSQRAIIPYGPSSPSVDNILVDSRAIPRILARALSRTLPAAPHCSVAIRNDPITCPHRYPPLVGEGY